MYIYFYRIFLLGRFQYIKCTLAQEEHVVRRLILFALIACCKRITVCEDAIGSEVKVLITGSLNQSSGRQGVYTGVKRQPTPPG